MLVSLVGVFIELYNIDGVLGVVCGVLIGVGIVSFKEVFKDL